jgi:hypothetical protein
LACSTKYPSILTFNLLFMSILLNQSIFMRNAAYEHHAHKTEIFISGKSKNTNLD